MKVIEIMDVLRQEVHISGTSQVHGRSAACDVILRSIGVARGDHISARGRGRGMGGIHPEWPHVTPALQRLQRHLKALTSAGM